MRPKWHGLLSDWAGDWLESTNGFGAPSRMWIKWYRLESRLSIISDLWWLSLLAPRMEKWKCGPRYLTFSFLKGRVTCLLLLGLVNVWRIWYATGLEFHSCTTVGNVSGCLCYRLSCHQEICGWSDQETVGWCQNRHQVGAPGAKAGHPMEAPGGSLWSPTWLLLSPKSVLCISLYLGASGTCPMPAARCHYRPLLTRAS